MVTEHIENFRNAIGAPWMIVAGYPAFGAPGPFPAQSNINTGIHPLAPSGYAIAQRNTTPVGTANGNYLLHMGSSPKTWSVDEAATGDNGGDYDIILDSPQTDWPRIGPSCQDIRCHNPSLDWDDSRASGLACVRCLDDKASDRWRERHYSANRHDHR